MHPTTGRASRRVLCVDDEPNILAALTRTLADDFDVDAAASAEEGLAALAQPDVDYAVVISDLRMPAMDGTSFLAAARRLRPGTIRILLSGAVNAEAAFASVEEGEIFCLLTKPCPPALLRGTVAYAVAQHRSVSLPPRAPGRPSVPAPATK
jgi:DNA-binding NtrC family response regulator